jgi:hydrogenase-4 component E
MIEGVGLDIVKILLVFIVLNAALIITMRDFLALTSLYSVQSLLIVLVALVLYAVEQNPLLLLLAAITLISKVIIVPIILTRVQRKLKIKRDIEFSHLSPVGSIVIAAIAFFFIYAVFFSVLSEFHRVVFSIAVSLSVCLVFMGLIIIFTRKQTIVNVIGYLTMENGVLLFSLFVAELSLLIEVLILLDLIMLTVLVALMAFGIDSSIEEFHEHLNMVDRLSLDKLFGGEKR